MMLSKLAMALWTLLMGLWSLALVMQAHDYLFGVPGKRAAAALPGILLDLAQLWILGLGALGSLTLMALLVAAWPLARWPVRKHHRIVVD